LIEKVDGVNWSVIKSVREDISLAKFVEKK